MWGSSVGTMNAATPLPPSAAASCCRVCASRGSPPAAAAAAAPEPLDAMAAARERRAAAALVLTRRLDAACGRRHSACAGVGACCCRPAHKRRRVAAARYCCCGRQLPLMPGMRRPAAPPRCPMSVVVLLLLCSVSPQPLPCLQPLNHTGSGMSAAPGLRPAAWTSRSGGQATRSTPALPALAFAEADVDAAIPGCSGLQGSDDAAGLALLGNAGAHWAGSAACLRLMLAGHSSSSTHRSPLTRPERDPLQQASHQQSSASS